MAETALTRIDYTCLNCGAPVPSPITLCFACGGTPLIGDPSGEWSVTVDAVPSSKLRRDVSEWIASLFPGVDPNLVETRLADGNPPLWVTAGLSKVTAESMVKKLRAMHVPAKAHLGSPPTAAGGRRLLPTVVVGCFAVIVAYWVWWLAVVLGLLAIGLLTLRPGSARSNPIGLPEQAGYQDRELAGHVRGVLDAAASVPADIGATLRSINKEAGTLFAILADEQNPIGYVAGGVEGRIGVAAKDAVGVTASLASVLRRSGTSTGAAQRLSRVHQTLVEVRVDLDSLVRAPDDEPDLAGRLESNAQKLESLVRSNS